MIALGIFVLLLGGCHVAEMEKWNNQIDAARKSAATRSPGPVPYGAGGAGLADTAQTFAPTRPTPTPSTVYVHEDEYSSENHKCTTPGEKLVNPYHFKCGVGPDGVLRWLEDKEAAAAAAKAEAAAYWAANGGFPRSGAGSGAPGPAVVPDRYTGPRCYAPGGQTYTRC
jgi:hypothetical protein